MSKKLYAALFIIISAIPISAQNEDDFEGTIQDNLKPPALNELIDYNRSNNTKNGFSAHKMNYILPIHTHGWMNMTDIKAKLNSR